MPSLRSKIVQRIMRDAKTAILGNQPVEIRRRRFDAAASRGIRLPRGVSSRTIVVKNVVADLLIPELPVPGRVILYLHGGAYVIGSSLTHRGLAGYLSLASRSAVMVINYRLAPEDPFPAALDDALASFDWLLENGYLPGNISVGGDSAGGGLALAAALAMRDQSKVLPSSLFLMSPWTDLTFSGESILLRKERDPLLDFSDGEDLVRLIAGGYPAAYPYLSPLFADHRGLPSTLIQVGTEEILFDDSFRLEQKARQAGVDIRMEVWQGMWHVFQGFVPYIPEAMDAINKLGSFIQDHYVKE